MKPIKSIIFAILVVSLIFIIGCGTTTYICDDGSQVDNIDKCIAPQKDSGENAPVEKVIKEQIEVKKSIKDAAKTDEAVKEETPPEEQDNQDKEPVIEESLKTLFEEGRKVKSFQFDYYGPYKYDEMKTVYVKKPNMKVVFKTPIKRGPYEFDTIYLNANGQKSTAYCEDTNVGPCRNPNFEFEAPYNEFYVISPDEWLSNIVFAETETTEYILNRETVVIKTEWKDGGKGKIWLDNFYGVPHKVIKNGVEYEYRNLVVNSISDDIFKHEWIRPRENIEE